MPPPARPPSDPSMPSTPSPPSAAPTLPAPTSGEPGHTRARACTLATHSPSPSLRCRATGARDGACAHADLPLTSRSLHLAAGRSWRFAQIVFDMHVAIMIETNLRNNGLERIAVDVYASRKLWGAA
eukprot:1789173-Prymnesium_polylepis.1